jgi:hypothetical protein
MMSQYVALDVVAKVPIRCTSPRFDKLLPTKPYATYNTTKLQYMTQKVYTRHGIRRYRRLVTSRALKSFVYIGVGIV